MEIEKQLYPIDLIQNMNLLTRVPGNILFLSQKTTTTDSMLLFITLRT